MGENGMLSISEAADFLGISRQTLRRWDKAGTLRPSYISPGKHRYYRQSELRKFASDLFSRANNWALASSEAIPAADDAYCPTSSVFQARLATLETALQKIPDLQKEYRFSLVVAVVAEIGDNAFAHNLGQWPDIPGVFFAYDTNRRQVVVADRGVGILATLRQVRPSLPDHREALRVAFTERLSGRSPENRGGGLKFVRKIISQNNFSLFVQSGDARLRLSGGDPALRISSADTPLRGTLALIEFSPS